LRFSISRVPVCVSRVLRACSSEQFVDDVVHAFLVSFFFFAELLCGLMMMVENLKHLLQLAVVQRSTYTRATLAQSYGPTYRRKRFDEKISIGSIGSIGGIVTLDLLVPPGMGRTGPLLAPSFLPSKHEAGWTRASSNNNVVRVSAPGFYYKQQQRHGFLDRACIVKYNTPYSPGECVCSESPNLTVPGVRMRRGT
jgi:hypothetical protein